MNRVERERFFLEDLQYCRQLCILKSIGAMPDMKESMPSEEK